MALANPSKGLGKRVGAWLIAVAVVFIILGMIAIVEPGIAGLAVAILVGWLLIFGGVTHLITSFRNGGAGRVIWQVILAIIYILGGPPAQTARR